MLRSLILLPVIALFVITNASGQGIQKSAAAVQQEAMPASAKQVLAADTPLKTLDGNSFVAPVGWTLERQGAVILLSPPENDSRIVLMDISAADAESAVQRAWQAVDPNMKRPLKLAQDIPPRDGWAQMKSFRYETSANDKRGVGALAAKQGERWNVVLYDVGLGTGEKRSGQIAAIFDRLLPSGYKRESFAGMTAHRLDAKRLDALREFVEGASKELGVPGVAIGIVQNGEVVMSQGFGVRAMGKAEQVDGDTRFMIASNTKALTTLMLARLVAQGKFVWDTPVTEILPSFALGNAETTRQVLVKHLICACTGMPRQDLEWLFQRKDATPASAMRDLAKMQPTSEFGALFQYSNPMAAAAGFAGGYVLNPKLELGAAYAAAMQSEVFGPLGMKSTTLDFSQAMSGNFALPHGSDVDGNTVPASMDLNYTVIPVGPAGAAWSTVNDLLRYVQMEITQGLLPGGGRYLDQAPLLERRAQQIAIGNDIGYGMGLMVDSTWGIPVVQHGGDMIGFHSNMLWLPEHNIGAVILTNSDSGINMVYSFQRRLLEVLFDGKPEAVVDVDAAAKRFKERIVVERKRLDVPAATDAVAKLAGRYINDQLGEIRVIPRGKAAWFDFGTWESEVASRRNNDGTLSFVTISPGEDGFEFVVSDVDGRQGLTIRDAQHEYVFKAALPEG